MKADLLGAVESAIQRVGKCLRSVEPIDTRSRSAFCLAALVLLGVSPVVADEASQTDAGSSVSSGMPIDAVPDIRDDNVPFKAQKG